MQTDTFRMREVSEFCFFHGFEYEDGTCRKVSELGWVAMLLCFCIAIQIFRDALSVCQSSGRNCCRVESHLCWLMSIGSCEVMRSHAMWSQFASIFQQPQLLLFQFFSKALQPEVFQPKEAFENLTCKTRLNKCQPFRNIYDDILWFYLWRHQIA